VNWNAVKLRSSFALAIKKEREKKKSSLFLFLSHYLSALNTVPINLMRLGFGSAWIPLEAKPIPIEGRSLNLTRQQRDGEREEKKQKPWRFLRGFHDSIGN